jgi:hypothetical protein
MSRRLSNQLSWRNRICLLIARHLIPTRLRYWIVVGAVVDATDERFYFQSVDKLSIDDLLKRIAP